MTDTTLKKIDHNIETNVDMSIGDPSGRDVCTIHRQAGRGGVLARQTGCVLDTVPTSNFLQLPEAPYPTFVSHVATQILLHSCQTNLLLAHTIKERREQSDLKCPQDSNRTTARMLLLLLSVNAKRGVQFAASPRNGNVTGSRLLCIIRAALS